MKINPVGIVVVVLVIAAAVYYFNHHKINVNVDVKGDEGSKSHMSIKHEAPKHDDDDNA